VPVVDRLGHVFAEFEEFVDERPGRVRLVDQPLDDALVVGSLGHLRLLLELRPVHAGQRR